MAAAQRSLRRALSLLLLGLAVRWMSSSVGFAGMPLQRRHSCVAAHLSAGYSERCGPRDADVPFKAAAATGDEVSVEFKKREFGILRYQPGEGGIGAMAMEILPKSRYPGDPQGQAFVSGVKSGLVVKSINGMSVLDAPFGKIMDLLDDEVTDQRFSQHMIKSLAEQGGRMAEPVETPLQITFASIPGYEYQGGELKEHPWEGYTR